MSPEQIAVIQALVDQAKAQLDAYTAVLTLAQNGYQSDQQAIADGIAAVITPVQAALTAALPQTAQQASPAQPAPAI